MEIKRLPTGFDLCQCGEVKTSKAKMCRICYDETKSKSKLCKKCKKFEVTAKGLCRLCYAQDRRGKAKMHSIYEHGAQMKRPELPELSNAPCKSIVVENIHNIEKGKALTAPLSYLNRSCEFRQRYEKIVGPIFSTSAERVRKMRSYHDLSPEEKERAREHQRAYHHRHYKAKRKYNTKYYNKGKKK
jgi:hypothetical protein